MFLFRSRSACSILCRHCHTDLLLLSLSLGLRSLPSPLFFCSSSPLLSTQFLALLGVVVIVRSIAMRDDNLDASRRRVLFPGVASGRRLAWDKTCSQTSTMTKLRFPRALAPHLNRQAVVFTRAPHRNPSPNPNLHDHRRRRRDHLLPVTSRVEADRRRRDKLFMVSIALGGALIPTSLSGSMFMVHVYGYGGNLHRAFCVCSGRPENP